MKRNQVLVLMGLAIVMLLAILIILYFMYVKAPHFYMSYMLASLNASQTTNIGSGDHITYNNIIKLSGRNIGLDTTTPYTNNSLAATTIGAFSLQSGHTYNVTVGFSGKNIGSGLIVQIHAMSNSIVTNLLGTAIGPTFTLTNIINPPMQYTTSITPTVATGSQSYIVVFGIPGIGVSVSNVQQDCFLVISQTS